MGRISKTFALFLILIIAISYLTVLMIKPTTAQTYESITIKADGNINPPTASITKTGNVYKLTSDIFGNIKVEKFNIVLDGAGFNLKGNNAGSGIQIFNPHNATPINSLDVTIKNFKINSFDRGIDVVGFWGNNISGVSIEGNYISNNRFGVIFTSYSRISNNVIIGNIINNNNQGIAIQMGHVGDESGNNVSFNQIAHNQVGMYFLWMGDYYSWKPNPFQMNNRIYSNNFIDNNQNTVNGHVIYDPDCANIWDNGFKGNYWSDYNSNDSNNDGIADGNYTIDSNNIDRYPLMSPVVDSPIPALTVPPTASPFPPTDRNAPHLDPIVYLIPVAVIAAVVIVSLLLYRRHQIHSVKTTVDGTHG